MGDFKNIVKVDIATGEVLENNLRAFWDTLTRGDDLSATPRHPAIYDLSKPQAEVLIAERVKKFNSTRRHRNKNAWTDTELYQLAVLIVVQKQKFHQAAVQLTRSPRACRKIFDKMKDAGVI